MRKKILGTLLMGALVSASMSTLTSCKDYDDEVNNLQTQIDALSPLKNVKTELQTEIANLKTQLEAKDGELTNLINQLKTSTDQKVADLEAKVKVATASVASFEARIKTAEEALAKVNEALEGKADKAALESLVGKVAAVEESLVDHLAKIQGLEKGLADEKLAREAVQSDLNEQKEALLNYKKRIENLEANSALVDFEQLQSEVEETLEALEALINTNSSNIADMKRDIQTLSDKVTALAAEVDVLNVFVAKELRSLVFRPDTYYWGIESTKIQTLKFWNFTLPQAAWNVKEAKGYTAHARYDSVAGSRVLAFVANYHMNPSTAVIDPAKAKVTVLSDDKEFTRAAAAGLTVASWKAENGMLQVNLDATNPEKIKSVDPDEMVTVFATQVTLPGVNETIKERTITSDYATLRAESISDLKIAHRAGSDVPFLGVKSIHTSVLAGPDANHAHNNLLMQSAYEAANQGNKSQDSVDYDKMLDLRKLVEVHYTNADGQKRLMKAAELEANGMKFKFEITGLYYGENNTSESAHAAINPEDGYTFRPQMPEYDAKHVGKQQAYGAAQGRPTIGRTPLVRVSLLDKNGKVLDYGYIRILITETKTADQVKPDEFITYEGPDYNYAYNGECEDPATEWLFETKWINTVYDLYNKLNITREEFEKNYGETPEEDAANGGLKQYVLGANGKFVPATTRYGTAYTRNDKSNEDHTLTSILGWRFTKAEAKDAFVTKKLSNIAMAVKYVSKDKSKYPDIFVQIKTGVRTGEDTAPAGKVNIANNIIKEYWYKANTSEAGVDELHTQTITPEDNAGGTADKLDNTMGDVFDGNTLAANKLITVTQDLTKNKEYATGKLKLNVVFDASNNGKEYKGVDGVTYVMSVADNGKTLQANKKGSVTKQNVAKLDSPTDPSLTKISYQHSDFAHALLNYKGHDELADDVIKAIIGIEAQNQCAKTLPLTDNTFDVRFLRPINAKDAAKTIEDANITELQVIKAEDLLFFTDWRDAWNNKHNWGQGGEYARYYGITGVTIEGVTDGQSISRNPQVTTNLNQTGGKFVPLESVTNNIDFIYTAADGGKLTYKNLSTTVQEFQIKIPVRVEYIWGYITKDVTITVKKSVNNAKKF